MHKRVTAYFRSILTQTTEHHLTPSGKDLKGKSSLLTLLVIILISNLISCKEVSLKQTK